MLDWLTPHGQSITFVAGLTVVFGSYLAARHARNEASENARLQAELRAVAEETVRQVTGEGGYGTVLPYFTQISPEIVERRGIVIPEVISTTFGILNNSDAPVIEPLVIISQRVPVGEGFMGSDRKELFRGRVGSVYPGMGPTMLHAKGTIAKSHDNWFDVVVFSRAATFTQSIVVVWVGDSWETDYELRQLADADRNVEEKTLHSIRDDFPLSNEQRR